MTAFTLHAPARKVINADEPLPELSRVRAVEAIESWTGKLIPVGTLGTIVDVGSNGSAYSVEFGPAYEDAATVGREAIVSAAF